MEKRQYTMAAEFVSIESTECGRISLKRKFDFLKDLHETAHRHRFIMDEKALNRDTKPYKPTGVTIKIKTIEDMLKLTPQQFERYLRYLYTLRLHYFVKGEELFLSSDDVFDWVDK